MSSCRGPKLQETSIWKIVELVSLCSLHLFTTFQSRFIFWLSYTHDIFVMVVDELCWHWICLCNLTGLLTYDNVPYLDWVCRKESHMQMKMDCFSWKLQQRLHRMWMSFSMKLVCFKGLYNVWMSFHLKLVYIVCSYFLLYRESLKNLVGFSDTESLKVGCELGLFHGVNCFKAFFGIHITDICDCNILILVCMWCSKKVTKSSTCTATCWDGTYRQTSKPWPCSEVKLLLIMNLSESLPMEFQWQELWKYWRHLWHKMKGQDWHSGECQQP